MKIALRIAGALYLLYALILTLQIPRLLNLYQDFGAETPVLNMILIPFLISVWAILLFVASISQKFTNRVRIVLLFLSFLAPVVFYMYALILPLYNLNSQF